MLKLNYILFNILQKNMKKLSNFSLKLFQNKKKATIKFYLLKISINIGYHLLISL